MKARGVKSVWTFSSRLIDKKQFQRRLRLLALGAKRQLLPPFFNKLEAAPKVSNKASLVPAESTTVKSLKRTTSISIVLFDIFDPDYEPVNINIPRFESHVHTLGLSFQTKMTISHNPYQASSLQNSR